MFLAKHIADILFTEFYLIADTFTLTGELGFPGIYRDHVFIFSHFLPLLFMLWCLYYYNIRYRICKQTEEHYAPASKKDPKPA